jgi:protein ImuA
MAANAREVIEGLREEIRRIERRPARRLERASSGRREIDALLPGGGFPRGALSELAGGPASGKTAVALATLATAMGEDALGAFVDGRGELYPPAAAALGVDLERLLVVRPLAPRQGGSAEAARRALWAAEALLASGAFEVVAIDVPIEGSRGGAPAPAGVDAMLRRLRAAAEKGGTVGLWLGAPEGVRAPAAVRLELAAGGAGPEVRRSFARSAPVPDGGPPPARLGVDHAA